MPPKLAAAVLPGESWTYIRLSGVIDEANRLADLVGDVRGRLLVVDLAAVERINSCGVRDWVAWLIQLERTRADVVLADCSPAMVAQLNLVGNFAGQASVLSFCAPYYCDACDLERSRALRADALSPGPDRRPPPLVCDRCGGMMVFDDIEESFFAFLDDVRTARGRADAEQALADGRRRLAGEAAPANPARAAPPSSVATRRSPFPEGSAELSGTPEAPGPAGAAATPLLSQGDMAFYVAIGVLVALLGVVVYHIAVS